MNCDKLFPEDNEGPIISILKPLNFEKVNESVKILPLSPNYDIPKVDIEISRVQPISISNDSLIFLFDNELSIEEHIFLLDKQILGTDNDGKPLILYWNTTTKINDICCSDFPDSSIWFLNAKAYDSNNNKTYSDGIFIMVDNSISNPQPLVINSIILNENGNFQISWDRSNEIDFLSYYLTKSLTSEMLEKDTIYKTFNIDSTSYIDSLVNPLMYQYYAVTVLDTFGYSTESSIYSSSLDQPPNPIEIQQITYDIDSMTVIWKKSSDNDLKEIKLLHALSESSNKDTILTSSILNDTTYSISNFDPTIENWFWVMATDTFYQSSIGPGLTNEINLPPLKVNIGMISYVPSSNLGSFDISWDINSEEDFISYTLLESLDIDMINSTIMIVINDSLNSNYLIPNIDFGEIRYYQLIIEDAWGQKTYSDIYQGNSNYYFNEKYDLYETNDNLYSVLNQCNNFEDQCKYIIAGSSTPSGDTKPDIWVSIVDSLGFMDFNNDLMYSYTNSGEIDQINSVSESSDNNIIINATIGNYSSTAYDPKLIKLSSLDLSLLWEMNICEMDNNIVCSSDKNYSKSLIELDNDNLLITGYTKSNSDPDNLWMIQTDNNGFLINSFHRKTEYFEDSPPENDLCCDSQSELDSWLDSNGDGIWNSYNNDTRGFDIIQDGNDFISVGSIKLNNEKNIFISKYSSSLDTLLWEITWENPGDDEAYSIQKDNDKYIIGGYKTGNNKDIVILSINSDGSNLYEVDFQPDGGNSGDDVANKIIRTSDDYFILVGYTSSFGSGNKDIYISKFNNSFIEWENTFGCELDDIGNDIKETYEGSKGGFVISGKISNNISSDAWIIKVNHDGETNQIICDD